MEAEVSETLRKLPSTDAQALIVRISSPGGSAIASDKIWHALRNVSEQGIPVVASIGSVGASGGYYIACGADAIFAEDYSIVGSIGIYGGKVDLSGFMQKVIRGEWSGGEAPIQMTERLPEELKPLPTHHAGTHKFMVDDFCQAYWADVLSPTNAWQAARYNLPGLTAHRSAMEGGTLMEVPDPGDPPSGMQTLSPDRPKQVKDYRE